MSTRLTDTREPLLKGETRYDWPPCTSYIVKISSFFKLKMYFTCYITSYLNEEVSRIELSLSVSLPCSHWSNSIIQLAISFSPLFKSIFLNYHLLKRAPLKRSTNFMLHFLSITSSHNLPYFTITKCFCVINIKISFQFFFGIIILFTFFKGAKGCN